MTRPALASRRHVSAPFRPSWAECDAHSQRTTSGTHTSIPAPPRRSARTLKVSALNRPLDPTFVSKTTARGVGRASCSAAGGGGTCPVCLRLRIFAADPAGRIRVRAGASDRSRRCGPAASPVTCAGGAVGQEGFASSASPSIGRGLDTPCVPSVPCQAPALSHLTARSWLGPPARRRSSCRARAPLTATRSSHASGAGTHASSTRGEQPLYRRRPCPRTRKGPR